MRVGPVQLSLKQSLTRDACWKIQTLCPEINNGTKHDGGEENDKKGGAMKRFAMTCRTTRQESWGINCRRRSSRIRIVEATNKLPRPLGGRSILQNKVKMLCRDIKKGALAVRVENA